MMALVFWFPWLGLFSSSFAVRWFAVAGVCAMISTYLPTLRYYHRADSVGTDASLRRFFISSDDMVVRAALLAW